MQSGMVHLQRPAGDMLIIPLSRLSAADRADAQELAVESLSSARGGDTPGAGSAKERRPAGTLSDEEIAALKETWTDGKRSLRVSVTFVKDSVRARKEASRFSRSGEVPVRITAALYDARPNGGRTVTRRARGTCKMYVLDEEGRLVFKASEKLDKMCPT